MQSMINFWVALLGAVADFLLLEPISWFTAIFLLFAVSALVRKIVS